MILTVVWLRSLMLLLGWIERGRRAGSGSVLQRSTTAGLEMRTARGEVRWVV